jgi:catechol 2,3-dioxygenase-like lactoylglutathione lyase family enzyme
MAVLGVVSYALEIPALAAGAKFYRDAGLEVSVDGNVAHCRCPGQQRASVILFGGAAAKRLRYITLRAAGIDSMMQAVIKYGGRPTAPPQVAEGNGVWLLDPHGMLIQLLDCPPDLNTLVAPPFQINSPGALVRKGRAGILPRSTYGSVKPLRLGHVLVFTPDVMKSVSFFTEALGMGLADRAQEIIAFCCTKTNSDHHVVAFANSPGIGFHHASFQVTDPDEVGRAGRDLVTATGRGDWGFGRHTIGSNFFHYIQDPWGSWFEYYSDMDHIEDYSQWTPTNYGMQDSLANWGPPVPVDFVHNYEVSGAAPSRAT